MVYKLCFLVLQMVDVELFVGYMFVDNCDCEFDWFGGGCVIMWGVINYNFQL